ncbi:hypothetical protein CAEBREN_16695 [Caenorhabditis brenneri]|uniref:Uncharacterized protein n=1 Tax=Caenorhabditis brenneri TaxID=135651 RepID=G0MDK6_CAEBE|nr:hypothetical protein CAEBREN_16695 [Caenorhabditis brenneri]
MAAIIVFSYKDLAAKADADRVAKAKENFANLSSKEQEAYWDFFKGVCDPFKETDAYSDSSSVGYAICCEIPNECGTSGWVIFLIILLVLGILAGGAAAFWFFYWKRKNGGKEEMVEENTESTENSKTVIEIPVGTY